MYTYVCMVLLDLKTHFALHNTLMTTDKKSQVMQGWLYR